MDEGMELEDEITPDNSPQHSAFGGEDTESEAEDDSSTSGPMKPKGKTEFQTEETEGGVIISLKSMANNACFC